MEKVTPFGWLVVGTGRIANTVMSEITKTGRHRVAAVFSRTLSKAQNFADKFGAEVFQDIDAALDCKAVDGVYIATPHSVHYQYLLKCIEHGVPVLSEKSFTVNAKQTEAVFAAAAEKNVFVAEGMWTRFNPVVKKIIEWVKSGAIGDITEIDANFCLPVSVTKPFMSDRVYTAKYAGGALLDLGVYPVSYCQMLLGEPEKTKCVMRLEDSVDYDCKITLTYKNAVCNLNCSFDGLKTYHSLIKGTKGEIKSNMFYKPTHAVLYTDGKKADSARCKRGYIYEFDGVADDIRNGRIESALIPHRDTVAVMKILDECRRQGGLIYPDEIEKT